MAASAGERVKWRMRRSMHRADLHTRKFLTRDLQAKWNPSVDEWTSERPFNRKT
jgi:hypothetical protein